MTPELKALLYEKLITQFISSRLVAYILGMVAVIIIGKDMNNNVATVLGIIFGGFFTAKTAEQIGNAIKGRNGGGVVPKPDETTPTN